jgi:hypothetical protein
MLEVIENVHLSSGGFSGDNFLILWHIASFVNLSLMIDLDVDRYPSLLLICDTGATDSIGVIVKDILLIVPGVLG